MKLTELADEYLTFMVKSYADSKNRLFHWKQIREQFPDEDEEFICDAFRLMSKDGLVDNRWADNVVYICQLNVTAIRDAEENTLLRRTYSILKEIRSWI